MSILNLRAISGRKVSMLKAAIIAAAATLGLSIVTSAQAAPVGAAAQNTQSVAQNLKQDLTQSVRDHRYRGYRGYRGYRRHRGYYGRPVGYYAPVRYGRRVCRIRNQRVWTGYGYVIRPVRVCVRR
jgi:hypothetical protein